jgi:hypothetical protein
MKTTKFCLGLGLALAGLTLAIRAFAQGSLTPPVGPPAPTMKSLQQLSDQLAASSTIKVTGIFNRYVFIDNPAVAGGKVCTNFNIPAGTVVKLDSIVGSTYSDASAVPYLRYFRREGPSVSRILTLRLVSTAIGSDPVTNSRSFNEPTPMWLHGGTVFDVQDGEAHSFAACIQSSAGASASGTMALIGTVIDDSGAARGPASTEAPKVKVGENGTLATAAASEADDPH